MRSLSRLAAALALSALLAACSGGGGSTAKVISIDIGGTVRYEDKRYGTDGFTGETEMKPVRHAKVELVGDAGVIAGSVTDENGVYALSGSGSNLYVRVLAQSDGAAAHMVEVVRASNPAQLFAVRSDLLTAASSRVDIDIELATLGATAGVFNILDVYTRAAEFTAAQGGTDLPLLQARWEECSTDGTYTSEVSGTDDPYVYIALFGVHDNCGTSWSDTDEYDDDVMWHEYGHYLEFTYDTLDSPGGPHYLTDLAQDIRLAWSEGWGDFISGAIKEWLKGNGAQTLSVDTVLSSGWYIDTYDGAMFAYDFTTGSYFDIPLSYATSEGAVAKLLWDTHDHSSFGMDTIWWIFSQGLTPVGVIADLEAVWTGWSSAADPLSIDTMRNDILSGRLVDYSEDSFENDDSNPLADANRSPYSANAIEYHTLYKDDYSADIDTIPFTATAGNSYRIETFNLHNGADTLLTLIDDGGNTLSNDNHDGAVYEYDPDVVQGHPLKWEINDGCKLASRLEFTPQLSGTYYLRVESANQTLAAGSYGNYALQITENPGTTAKRCP
jgi:hypothetical protein